MGPSNYCQGCSSALLPANYSNQNTVILQDVDDTLNDSASYPTFATPPFISYDFLLEYASRHNHLLPPDCDAVAAEFSTLLPPNSMNQKTVVLDLDKTLIHSVLGYPPPIYYDFQVKMRRGVAYVTKRPFVGKFIEYLHQNNFEIVIFTAGRESFASPVLDKLDPKGLISHRLYRRSCKVFDGKIHVKDLSCLGRNLDNVVIVDDNPDSYRLQPENGINIRPFFDDLKDDELKKLVDNFFTTCNEYNDLKDAMKHYRDRQ
nr:Dullard phosphatase domain, eukaryotic [Tanacetum cinerariifolium]